MSIPEAAVIEIIERRHGQPNGTVGDEIVVPTEIRINGTRLLTPSDHPVKVHEMIVSPDGTDMALVTLTLVAKRITVGQEWADGADVAGRLQNLGLLPKPEDDGPTTAGVPA
jgi:hypothetical protein